MTLPSPTHKTMEATINNESTTTELPPSNAQPESLGARVNFAAKYSPKILLLSNKKTR